MKRLGEILVGRGLITDGQLQIALRNQLMLGGHLGTCLLELGFIDESHLGQTLAEVHGVPYATPEVIARVRGPVIRSIPKKTIEECLSIPLERSEKRLFVAMVNPRDLSSRDALAFASSCTVVPWVAPEVRIFEAMERFYAIPRRQRYIAIHRSLSPVELAAQRDAAATGPTAGRGGGEPPRKGDEPTAIWGDDPYLGDQRSWQEVANELFPDDATPNRPSETSPEKPMSPRNNEISLAGTAERLCAADSPDEVARGVIDEIARVFARIALFSVKSDELRLWEARGIGEGPASRRVATFPVSSDGILGHLEGEEFYCGPLRTEPENLPFYDWLGIRPPAQILLVPVHLNDRLVALIYGDAGETGKIGRDTRRFVHLARMLGYALTAIIYKNKIRGIGSLEKETTV